MWQTIKKWFQKGDIKRGGIQWVNGDAPWYGEPSPSGMTPTLNSVVGIPGFKRAIEIIATKLACCRIRAFIRLDDGGREFATDHPAWPILTRFASDHLTIYDVIKQLVMDALSCGNGYAYIRRGEEWSLVLLDPERMVPTVVNSGTDSSVVYMYNTDSGMIPINAEDVIHIKGPVTIGSCGLVGVGVLEFAKESLGLGLAVQRYASVYFKNGGLSDAWVETPDGTFLDEDLVPKILAALRRLHGGIDNAHAPMVLQGGAKLNKTYLNISEAQALSARGYTLTDVANLVGLPAVKIGGESGAQGYQVLREENQAMLSDVYMPWIRQFELQFERKLLRFSEWETHYIEFDTSNLTRADDETEQRVRQARFFAGEISWQQYRAEQNLPTTPDAKEVYFIPSNLVRFDPTAPMPEPVQPQAPQPPAPADDEEPKEEIARAAVARLIRRVEQDVAKHGAADLITRHEKVFSESLPGINTQAWLEELQDELTAVLPEQRSEVFRNLGDKWKI